MDLRPLEVFCKSLTNKDVDIRTFRDPERDAITISLVSQVRVSMMDFMCHGHKAIGDEIIKLRENILSSNLFQEERKNLAEYEKLKNMKFVLDVIKELDLSSIKEDIKLEYVDVRKMLGGK